MKTWASHLERRWFAVALASKIGRKPIRVVLLDRPIVLVRLDGRSVVGFEDRCPHRHAPLSAGRVINGTLQCPYHGWRFDAQGDLKELPGMPAEACLPKIRARVISVIEHDGLVWICLKNEADQDIPARARALHGTNRKFLWETVWQANIVDALENVLDPLHTHFVHAGLVRKSTTRCETRVRLSAQEDGFMVDYQGQSSQSGILYRLFESPRDSERSYFSGAGSVQLEYGYKNGSKACISLHFSPESHNRTRLIGMLHLDGRRVPSWAVSLFVWPFIRRVADQDRHMLALQAENTLAFPGRKDVITRVDIVRRYLLSLWGDDLDQSSNSIIEGETLLEL